MCFFGPPDKPTVKAFYLVNPGPSLYEINLIY